LDEALSLSDWKSFPERKKQSQSRGKLRGIGLSNAIERAAAPGMEYAEIRFDSTGTATLAVGTKSQGQGHETMYRQIAVARLAWRPKTCASSRATPTRSPGARARGLALGGDRRHRAVAARTRSSPKGKRVAAHLLEAAEADVAFAGGRFSIAGTDRGVSLREVARACFAFATLPRGIEPACSSTRPFRRPGDFSQRHARLRSRSGPADRRDRVLNYVVVDDVGTEINPLTLQGQVIGGIVQGLGQSSWSRSSTTRRPGSS